MTLLPCRPPRAVALGVAALVCASPLWAAETGQVAPSFESLIARLQRMPAAIEAAALEEAARARAQQAHAIPNPAIGWDTENIHGSGAYDGLSDAETTVSISQPLELFGQRGARVDAAEAEAAAAVLRSELLRWRFAGRLAEVYAEAEAASRRHALAAEALALAERDARAVALLVEQGREASLREMQARSEADAARAAMAEARALRDAAFARLSAIAALDAPVQALGDSLLDREPGVRTGDERSSLRVRIAEADLDAASRRVTLERRRARPAVAASIGMRRFRQHRDEALVAGVTLTLPLFDRNRGGIGAATAELRAADAQLVAARHEARADRLAAEAMLSASGLRVEAADRGVTAAAEAYRRARIGFDSGRISQLELRATRAALVTARGAALEARVARVRAEIALAGLQGRVPFGASR
jgi:cobalt-zinc-cadmium efflux system outer membrane protein